MDYEKKYKYAMEAMREWIAPCHTQEQLDNLKKTIFPELAESEDERIRKELIEHVKDQQSSFISAPDCRDKYEEEENNKYNSWLAWLEKQGEHKKFRDSIQVGDEVTRNRDGVIVNLSQLKRVAKKGQQKLPIEKLPEEMKTIEESLGFTTQEECDEYNQMVSELIMSDKVEPKFKVGDWVVNKGHSYLIADIDYLDNRYLFEIGGYTHEQLNWEYIENADNKYHLWTIKDAKDGDVLAEDTCTFIIKKLNHDLTAEIYCCLYDDGDFELNSNLGFDDTCTYPATKEQCDTLFAKMKEFGYEWDFEKKELIKIEKNADVNHEYFSELLKNDKSDNIADYAYQCVYCMSHDWAIENPTWDNVQSACRLGAKWQKKHDVSEDWSEEDEKMIGRVRGIIEAYAFSQSAVDVNGDLCEKKFIDVDIWLKSIKDRVYPKHEWKQENTGDLTDFENAMMHIGESFFGNNAGLDPNDIDAIKEQANTLLGLVPSKEWGEEDGQYLLVCKNALAKYQTTDKWDADIISCWLENKLKAPQNTWKPSDEQMEALYEETQKSDRIRDDRIVSLYNDLKKLTE